MGVELHTGFIPAGNDVHTAKMTFAEAKRWCDEHPECLGFTYRANESTPNQAVQMWFKSVGRVHLVPGWYAYVKEGVPVHKTRPAASMPVMTLTQKPTEVPKGQRRNLIFTSAGEASNLRHWLHGVRNWDLFIVYYGDDETDKYKEYADYYCRHKGGKFENLLWVYQRFQEHLEGYDAIWVSDDDVIIDGSAISCLFDIRSKYNILLCQPAFDPHGKISHPVTRLKPGNHFRFTNFVEMTCPLFDKQALNEFMDKFDPILKGWGADWWFLNVLGGPHNLKGKVAVVDAIPCINPHDVEKPGQQREIIKLQDTNGRKATWKMIQKRENLKEWVPVEYSTVPLITDTTDLKSPLAQLVPNCLTRPG